MGAERNNRRLPLGEEPVCDECLMAFWEGIAGPPEADYPSKHVRRRLVARW
jgi:hypothetical protein